MKKAGKILCIVLVVAVLLCVGGLLFLNSMGYSAGMEALNAMESGNGVTIEQADGYVIFTPEDPEAGFIFYPGGNVEHTAYAPLLRQLAEENILCVLPQMPLNLAVLDLYAAEPIPECIPEIHTWYIGGHSLGGSAACFHLEKTEDEYAGLVLLGSYSSVDLSQENISVLSLYGSEDGIMNRENYENSWDYLPDSFTEVVIEGGNHCLFGDYGHQIHDGEASITPEEQRDITCSAILAFMEP